MTTLSGSWQTCHCGKTFHVRGAAAFIPTLCRVCSADAFAELDQCPQVLPVPGGSSGCRLAYRHTGRCEPFEDITAEPEDS